MAALSSLDEKTTLSRSVLSNETVCNDEMFYTCALQYSSP